MLTGTPYGTAVDIFSLGVILYILFALRPRCVVARAFSNRLSGCEPFSDETQEGVYVRVLECQCSFAAPIWSPISFNAKVSLAYDAMLMIIKMLIVTMVLLMKMS